MASAEKEFDLVRLLVFVLFLYPMLENSRISFGKKAR